MTVPQPKRPARRSSRSNTLTLRVLLTPEGLRAARERLETEEQRLRLEAQEELMQLLGDSNSVEPEGFQEEVEEAREAFARAQRDRES